MLGGEVLMVLTFAFASFAVSKAQDRISDTYDRLLGAQERLLFWLVAVFLAVVAARSLAQMKLSVPQLLVPVAGDV